jgi:hypothetical protein
MSMMYLSPKALHMTKLIMFAALGAGLGFWSAVPEVKLPRLPAGEFFHYLPSHLVDYTMIRLR